MEKKSPDERRSDERTTVSSRKPAYIQTQLNGADVGLFVEDLSVKGAGLICPEDTDALNAGNRLEDCTLVLPKVGRIPVQAVVRWRLWPKVGLEFDPLSEEARRQISRFVEENRLRA
ncbi:MAG TPA: PilZ domain-containing protein [Terriglobia bacterium]|nr:PilZ domain-containing protein [Terriglobia bacterium]